MRSVRRKEKKERFKKEVDSIYISDYEEREGIEDEVLNKYYKTYPERNREKDLKDAYTLIYSFAKKEKNVKRYRYILEGINSGILHGTKTSEALPLSKLKKRTRGRSIISRSTHRKKRKIHPEEENIERFKKEVDSIYISDYEEREGIEDDVLNKYYECFPDKKRNRKRDIKDAYSLIYSFANDEENNKKYRYILEGINTGILYGTKTIAPLPLTKLRPKRRSIIPKLTYRKERKIHPYKGTRRNGRIGRRGK